MRDMTHHVSNRPELFARLKKFLKPDGEVAIVEYIEDEKRENVELRGHFVPKKIIVEEMKSAGYVKIKDFDFLPEHHFTVYNRKTV
jgi:roadblock/LC7 domain-containing protein